MSFNNLETRKIYNDVIDEAYELEEDDNEVLEEKKIKNELIDGEINVSDDSENYIPTPREDEDELEETEEPGNATQRVYDQKEGFATEESELDFGHTNFAKSQNKDSEKEIENLNLDQHTKDLFKYIKVLACLHGIIMLIILCGGLGNGFTYMIILILLGVF